MKKNFWLIALGSAFFFDFVLLICTFAFMNRVLLFTLTFLACLHVGKAQNSKDMLVPFRKGDKWGFSDPKKNIKVKPIFDKVLPFERDASKTTGNSNGQEVTISLDGSYTQTGNTFWETTLFDLSDGLMTLVPPDRAIEVDTKLSYTPKKHGFRVRYLEDYREIVYIAPVYTECVKHFDNRSKAIMRLEVNQKLGVVDTLGNILLPFEYEEIKIVYNKTGFGYIVKQKEKYGFWKNNKLMLPIEYQHLEVVGNHEKEQVFFIASLDGYRQGIIDGEKSTILPYEYKDIKRSGQVPRNMYGYRIKSIQNNHEGFFNLDTQKIFIPCKYKYIEGFKEYNVWLSMVENEEGVRFYIDEKGTEYYEK